MNFANLTIAQTNALTHLKTRVSLLENVSLARFSTIKVGGPARFFATPNHVDEIALIQTICRDHEIALHVVSGGSNTLFSDEGFDGIVVKLGPAFDYITTTNRTAMVGAATSFAKLTKSAMAQGFGPAVGFSGTPGLVGGAIRGNAGTRMGEIKDAVEMVYGVLDGQIVEVHKSALEFSYRSSSLPSNFIIHAAKLSYSSSCESVDALLEKALTYRSNRRATQPTNNSLGSFFKNPYPMYAAQLIEKCNLKGLHYKGAQISLLHANFIVNNGGASAHDILYLAAMAQKTVFEREGVILIPEIRMVGFAENPLCIERFATMPNSHA